MTSCSSTLDVAGKAIGCGAVYWTLIQQTTLSVRRRSEPEHDACLLDSDRRPITPRITPPTPHPRPRIDRDPMRMPRQLVPLAPAVQRVAAALELGDGLGRKARLDVQRVARLAERKAA